MKITDQELKSYLDAGKSMNDIAKEFRISLSTVRYWCKKLSLTSQYGTFTDKSDKTLKSYSKDSKNRFKNFKKPVDESHLNYQNWTEEQRAAYSYILGFFLGDGCLWKNKKKNCRTYILNIANNSTLTRINDNIVKSLNIVFPNKKISIYKLKNCNCIQFKIHAVDLFKLFPYGEGVKHLREIKLTKWQIKVTIDYAKEFIKGMIESDGCRFAPRKKQCPNYIIYQFINCSLDLHKFLHNSAKSINLEFTFRENKQKHKDGNSKKYLTSFNKKEVVEILEEFIGPKN